MLEGGIAPIGEAAFANQFAINEEFCWDLNICSVEVGKFLVPVIALNFEEESVQCMRIVEATLWMMSHVFGLHPQSVG